MPNNDFTTLKDSHLRSKLFAVSYRMTGSVMDSEDAVQEVLLSYTQKKPQHVEDETKYLAKAVIYKTLDVLQKKAQVKYIGTSLPEPLTDPVLLADMRQDVTYGTLLLLRELNPLERAAFVLKECFDFEYDELASILEQTPTYCRQLLHRAKEKIRSREAKGNYTGDAQQFQQLFMRASQSGDLEELIAHLQRDIVVYSDGGGKVKSGVKPVVGIEYVTRFIGSLQKRIQGQVVMQPVHVNHQSGLALISKHTGQIDTLVVIETNGNLISNLYLVRNPDKLKAVRSFY